MTRFEELKNMDIETLAEWFDEYGQFDGSPWCEWWDENYCDKCPSETVYVTEHEGEYQWQASYECAWCELHNKCKYFSDLEESPSCKDIVKMWLQSSVED